MRMVAQRMSQSEFAAYIAQRIRAGYFQSRAPQLIALSEPDCAGKSTLRGHRCHIRERIVGSMCIVRRSGLRQSKINAE